MMTKARIMVVEDDRIVARDIREQLVRIGHSVVAEASRGETALRLAAEIRPDLVLMDIRLEGELDGIDTAQQISERFHAPVVFLTAYADDETVRRASRAEPFGYLLKPFEDLQLRTVIEMALYKHAADRKLRDGRRRYEATLSSIGDGVIATDERGRVTFINPVASALTGWSRQDAIGKLLSVVYQVVDGDTRKPLENLEDRILRSVDAYRTADQAILISRTSQEYPVDEKGSPIVDDAGFATGAVLVFSDRSERRKAAEDLQNAQADLARISRVTTMGQLMASIAHEVNQPLMAVVMNADACVRWLADDRLNIPEARKAAGRVVTEGHRAGEIVGSIRSLVRNAPVAFARLDLNDLIESTLGIIRTELRHQRVVFEARLQAGPLFVTGDRVQLQQVMLNLILNAVDAINAPGLRERLLEIETTSVGTGEVRVTVGDSGIGIDPAIADRIFSAFFTTKGEGMGMGLSICRSIIDAHGGQIWAEGRVPTGSRFSFVLPGSQA